MRRRLVAEARGNIGAAVPHVDIGTQLQPRRHVGLIGDPRRTRPLGRNRGRHAAEILRRNTGDIERAARRDRLARIARRDEILVARLVIVQIAAQPEPGDRVRRIFQFQLDALRAGAAGIIGNIGKDLRVEKVDLQVGIIVIIIGQVRLQLIVGQRRLDPQLESLALFGVEAQVARRIGGQRRVDGAVREAARFIGNPIGTIEHQVVGRRPAQGKIGRPVVEGLVAEDRAVGRGSFGDKEPLQSDVDIGLGKGAVLGFMDIAHAAGGFQRRRDLPHQLAIAGQRFPVRPRFLGIGDIAVFRSGGRILQIGEHHRLEEVPPGFLVERADHQVDRRIEVGEYPQFLAERVVAGIFRRPDAGAQKVAIAGELVVVPVIVGDRADRDVVERIFERSGCRPGLVGIVQATILAREGIVLRDIDGEVILVEGKILAAGIAGRIGGLAGGAIDRDIVPAVADGAVIGAGNLELGGQPVVGFIFQGDPTDELAFLGLVGRCRCRAVRIGVSVAHVERRIADRLLLVGIIATPHARTAQGNPDAQRVGQRLRDNCFGKCPLCGKFVADPSDIFRIQAGIGGGQRNHAGGGVLAKEERLRAFQHLDPREVEKPLVDHPALAIIDAVHDDGDGLFDADRGGGRSDAAQGKLGTRTIGGTRDREIGRRRSDLLEAGQVSCGDFLGADRLHRDRNRLGGLFAAAGGDDDRLQAAGLGRVLLGVFGKLGGVRVGLRQDGCRQTVARRVRGGGQLWLRSICGQGRCLPVGRCRYHHHGNHQ